MTLQEKMNDVFIEGKAEGEKENSLSIAKSLIEQGISEDIVETSTKLSKEEILKIKEELAKDSSN